MPVVLAGSSRLALTSTDGIIDTAMKKLLFSTALAFALLAGTLASAHDAKLHKGKATEGDIVSVEALKMTLKTPTGPLIVTLSDKTKYEHGSQTVTKSHLQTGGHVTVFGTKLATGELVATEVLLGAPAIPHPAHK
jgi:uncharacterized protein DUF5666